LLPNLPQTNLLLLFIDFDELVKFANIYLGIPVCTLPGVDLKINIKEKKANWINKQSNSPLKDDSENCNTTPSCCPTCHKQICFFSV
jgi:hypothetical protein